VLEETVVGPTGFVKREEELDAGATAATTATSNGLSSGFKPLLALKISDATDGGMSVGKNAKKPPAITTSRHHEQPPPSQPQRPSPSYPAS
jgi:hypothetical protein